ncbi:MAG: hypothetical protein AB8B71_13335 [Paracoccaceae bacterium]
MSDIEAYQTRILAALERATVGLDKVGAGDAAALNDLQSALDEEKTVTAQLEERLKVLKEKHTSELAAMAAQMQDTQAKVSALDVELQRMQQVNSGLRESNAALRDANAAGVGDATLINAALQTELDALQAARAADVAEASAILSALTPVLSATEQPEETADA